MDKLFQDILYHTIAGAIRCSLQCGFEPTDTKTQDIPLPIDNVDFHLPLLPRTPQKGRRHPMWMKRNLFYGLLLLLVLTFVGTMVANPAPLPHRHSPQRFHGRYQYASWTLIFYSSGYYEAYSAYSETGTWVGYYGLRDNVFTIRETNTHTHHSIHWTVRRDQLQPTGK